jgi:DNA-binding ferritin-like protein
LPEAARLSKSYTAWKRELTDWIYRNKTLQLYENTELKLMSEPNESERDFQIRIQQAVRETRDDKLEDLRKKYTKRIQSLEEKIRKAEQAVEREKEQAKTQGLQTVISLGSTLLSAFLGKKAVSATTLGKATTAARGASRALKEQGDINRSKETVEAYSRQLQELEQEFRQETDNLAAALDEAAGNITERQLNPLKKDIMIRSLVILWVPAD